MTNRHKNNIPKVVIIGAGPAGLTAGYELLKHGAFHLMVAEESDDVGGISKTLIHNGNRIDLGGHRFFSKNDRVMQWWQDILPVQGKPSCDDLLLGRKKDLPPNGPDPETTDTVMLVRQRVSRIYFSRRFFDYPVSLCWQTFRDMGIVNTVKVAAGYLFSVCFKRKEHSLEDFYINRFGKPLYRMFFEDYTQKIWGLHPSQLDADWGAQRVKDLSLMSFLAAFFRNIIPKAKNVHQRNVKSSLIKQFIYPKYGPGQLWETVADRIRESGGEIRFGCRVTQINTDAGRVTSVVVAQGDASETIECDCLLSSMPVKELFASLRGINIPDTIKSIAENLPYRDFMTVGLLVDRLRIDNQTNIKTVNRIIPDTWVYIQDRDVRIGRLQVFNNWSPYMVKDYCNTVWLGLEYFCTEGDELWNMSDTAFIQTAIDELVQLQIIRREDVRDSVRIKVKKAYPAYYGSYRDMNRLTGFLDGIENLYCIGRNGQHRYNNMDHSMLTAMAAVHSILTGKDKHKIWEVNTESDYHEKTNHE
jgi:protoporphyrinogen oxidase